MTCSSPTDPAISGQYASVATVTGQPVDATGNDLGPLVADTDLSRYTGSELPSTGAGTVPTAVVGGSLVLVGCWPRG